MEYVMSVFFCHSLLVSTGQGHSRFKGRKLGYSTSGSSGKAPLQKSTQHAIFGNNWQKEKETIYGRTGDVGKQRQTRRLRVPECVLSIRDLLGVHIDS